MTTSLAPAPNLEQIKKQAKELLRAFRAQSPAAAQRFRDSHPELTEIAPERLLNLPLQLSDSQLVIAREYGFPSWPKLKEEVDRRTAETGQQGSPATSSVRRNKDRVWIEGVPNLKWGKDRETTFCGALANALSVTEHPYSYGDLMGLSGLAFRTRWFQGNETPDCCPSSPVGEFSEDIRALCRATGWPIWSGYRLGEEDKSMAPYWPEVVASIDEGRPVLAYNLQMDVGIIYGYREEDRSIIGWDYHQQGDEPVEMPLEKIGAWIAFIDKYEGAVSLRDAFVESLRIGVANYRRDTYDATHVRGDYRYGQEALNAWGSDLTQSDASQGEYHGKLFFVNWWTFNCLQDARAAAVDYLRDHADLLPGTGQEAVRKAANLYAAERGILCRTYTQRDVFLGPWTGKSLADWTPEVKSRECALLAECAALEIQAIAALEEAIASAIN